MRQLLIVATAVLIGCILTGLLFSSLSTAQAPTAFGSATGRYKATMVETAAGQSKVLVCDTATGQCWTYHSNRGDKWHDLGSPAAEAK
jgi:hypothetical protein